MFDHDYALSLEELTALVEAARWAPSANNSQPWKLVVASRNSPIFESIRSALIGFNQAWTPTASALVVVLGEELMSNGQKWDEGKLAFNLGLASSQIVFEAEARSLKAHYMSGLDHAALLEALGLSGFLIPAVIAIGKQGDVAGMPEDLVAREKQERSRKPIAEILLNDLAN